MLQQPQFSAATEDDLARAHSRQHIAMIRDFGAKRRWANRRRYARRRSFLRRGALGVRRCDCRDRASTRGRMRQRFRDCEAARASCGKRARDGLLFVQHRRGGGALCAGNRRLAARRDSRFRRASWQRNAGNLLRRRKSFLREFAPRFRIYPGTGAAREIGAGNAIGTTRNVPLPAGLRRRAIRSGVAHFGKTVARVLAANDFRFRRLRRAFSRSARAA